MVDKSFRPFRIIHFLKFWIPSKIFSFNSWNINTVYFCPYTAMNQFILHIRRVKGEL